MRVIRLLCSPRNHRDRSRYGSIPGKGEGMAEPLRGAVADSLDILQGSPHRVNRTSSRESAPDPQLSSSSSLFVLTRINQSGRLDGKMEVGSKLHLDPERRPSCSPYPKPLCHCCARSPGLACCRRPSACSL